MANIKFGNGWADARGKVGGVIYSKNKGGSYAKNYTKPANPRTPKQVAQRNIFSYVSSNWRMLTDGQRNSWNSAASQVPVSNKVGEKIHLTGAQYFNKQNIDLFVSGVTTIATSPQMLVDIVGAVVFNVVGAVTAGAVADAKMSAILVDGTTETPTGYTATVYATSVLSNGITRPQPSAYEPIEYIGQETSLTGVDLLALYVAQFGAPMPPDSNVWFAIELFNGNTGQRSQRLETKMTFTVTP